MDSRFSNTLIPPIKTKLALFEKTGSIQIIDQPFNEFSGLYSYQNRLVSIASSSVISQGIFEIDLSSFKLSKALRLSFNAASTAAAL